MRRGGVILRAYENSLTLTLLAMFVISFVLHALGSLHEFNAEQREHGQAAVTFGQFLLSSQLWFESFQNWQSEFLSVGVLVTLSIFLRQRGSPESKPVHVGHFETGKG